MNVDVAFEFFLQVFPHQRRHHRVEACQAIGIGDDVYTTPRLARITCLCNCSAGCFTVIAKHVESRHIDNKDRKKATMTTKSTTNRRPADRLSIPYLQFYILACIVYISHKNGVPVAIPLSASDETSLSFFENSSMRSMGYRTWRCIPQTRRYIKIAFHLVRYNPGVVIQRPPVMNRVEVSTLIGRISERDYIL